MPPPALDAGAGWIDRSDRGRLRVTGPDRAKFLHNLTTNDVKRLAVGRGHESFVTSPQGKTLGYVTILAEDAALLVRADPGGLSGVLPHLQKYGIFDDVALEDVGAGTFEYHVAGLEAGPRLSALGAVLPPGDDLAHVSAEIAGRPVRLVRESPTGLKGFSILGDRADAEAVASSLGGAGFAPIPAEGFEALRVEAGTPVFGREVLPENLPQEIDRDARAINFVKGCYLGQETVARLDALGHVNKVLRRLTLEGTAVPPAGTPLEAGGKRVGSITSSAFSAGLGRPVALGIVRVAHADPGSALLAVVDGADPISATVIAPPGA